MDNAYVHGLRQYDNRPRSPVVVPRDMSALRKKILFENTLLEERTLHEFSAGKGDGAGVDTGSAPLKPLTSPTPSPTPTPTPAPSGIPTATTNTVNITVQSINLNQDFNKSNPDIWYDNTFDAALQFYNSQWLVMYQDLVYTFNSLPNQTVDYIPLTGWNPANTTVTVVA